MQGSDGVDQVISHRLPTLDEFAYALYELRTQGDHYSRLLNTVEQYGFDRNSVISKVRSMV